jgi:hypothetical protein
MMLLLAISAILVPEVDFAKEQPFPSTTAFASVTQPKVLLTQYREGCFDALWCDLGTQRIASIRTELPAMAGRLLQGMGTDEFRQPRPLFDQLQNIRVSAGNIWATRRTQEAAYTASQQLLRVEFPPNSSGKLPASDASSVTTARHWTHKELSALGVNSDEGTDLGGLLYGDVRDFQIVAGLFPLRVLAEQADFKSAPPQKPYRFALDILPLRADYVRMFVLTNDLLSVWDYKFDCNSRYQGGRRQWRGTWQLQAILPSPVAEPFRVAASEGIAYLVTNSGRIYSAEEKKPREWIAKEVWTDKSRPIIGMLCNTENDGAYVFGKDFYFKLGKKIEVKPCRDVTKREAKETNKDLEKLVPSSRLAYECGRVLYEKGELKPEPAKK